MRGDFIKCAIDERQSDEKSHKKLSFCGKKKYSYDWCFIDPSHAIYSILNGSTTLVCPDCCREMIRVLERNIEEIEE